MITFPNSPRLLKDVIIVEAPNLSAKIIIVQYNPDTLTRTLNAQTTGGNTNRGENTQMRRLSEFLP